jgi:hypothetical protein
MTHVLAVVEKNIKSAVANQNKNFAKAPASNKT